jgi:hypothetical protein
MTDHPTQREPSTSKARLIVGGFVFIFAQSTILFIPLVSSLPVPEGWKPLISGLLVVGIPQVFTILSITILGKQGFNYLRSKLKGAWKQYVFRQTVSPVRYYIGLILFIFPLLFGWIVPYFPQLIPSYKSDRFTLNFIGDIMLVSSFFVLGGDFWDKVRSLFIPSAKANFSVNPNYSNSK